MAEHLLFPMGWRRSSSYFHNHMILLVCILALLLKFVDSSHSHAVKFLPGFQGPLPFHLETGYVEVGEPEEGLHIFYYFIKSERNPEQDPLVVWFTGGPGCSSFSALISIGPLQFNIKEYNGSLPTLFLNPHRWSKICSMLFIDLPIGTGFSYPLLPSQRTASIQVQHTIQFLKKWLVDHQQYLSNSLYTGGESYSGFTVPAVASEIVESNEKGFHPWINFQGYMLGNPFINFSSDDTFKIRFAHAIGLIPDELYESLTKDCGAQYQDTSNVNCMRSKKAYEKDIAKVNEFFILDPQCDLFGQQNLQKGRSLYKKSRLFLKSEPMLHSRVTECRHYNYLLAERWASDHDVQKALGVREGTAKEWKRCTRTPYEYDIDSSYPYLVKLSFKGYPSLIYSGDHDMMASHIGTQAWIRSLNYSIVDDWRPWFVEDEVAGYTRTYSNRMTFATVKGAGHVAPDYKPKECAAMFRRWSSKTPL